jgi:hypothetical protein
LTWRGGRAGRVYTLTAEEGAFPERRDCRLLGLLKPLTDGDFRFGPPPAIFLANALYLRRRRLTAIP